MTERELPIFVVSDGKLVRKPNGKRDPAKRYSHVSHPDGDYLREFTEEEERQRDKEERKWEEDRPKRESEEKRRLEEQKRFRNSLEYRPRVLAFLDVLGWRQAIELSSRDANLTKQLGVALAGLRDQVWLADWQQKNGPWPNDPQVTQFSDTIAVSYSVGSAADRAQVANQMHGTLRFIINQLMMAGLFVRGAVVEGPLLHKQTIVYGPALISAIDLEKNATDPRVVLDERLAEAWGWGKGMPIVDRAGNLLEINSWWRQDDDGKLFFDFLRPWPLNESNTHHREMLGIARRTIASNLEAPRSDDRTFRKYCWLACYFNCICDAYTVTEVKKISI